MSHEQSVHSAATIDDETATSETELGAEQATQEIERAVSARHSIARKWIARIRRRHPDATPAEVIQILERHYGTSISTAGAMITVGTIAADVGIALIPVAGAAAAGVKSAGTQAAKKAGKEGAKVAAKGLAKAAAKTMALGAAKTGAEKVAGFLPAGDAQIQFEITAVFGLALAEIHGMNLDKEQAQALVYGLSNERVGPQQIATMAKDVAEVSAEGAVGVGQNIVAGRQDWSHWASTLADTLPGGAAQSLVRTIQTGELNTVREGLTGKQQATIEYGVGALAGGVARFVFGRDVVKASRTAFPAAPEVFPPHLAVPFKAMNDDGDEESNRALAALEDAAKATGGWVTDAASSVGGGVAGAATSVSRVFRSVDLDGDGVPDEPQALTAVKGAGSALAGAASSVGGGVAGLFKRGKRGAANPEAAPTDDSD